MKGPVFALLFGFALCVAPIAEAQTWFFGADEIDDMMAQMQGSTVITRTSASSTTGGSSSNGGHSSIRVESNVRSTNGEGDVHMSVTTNVNGQVETKTLDRHISDGESVEIEVATGSNSEASGRFWTQIGTGEPPEKTAEREGSESEAETVGGGESDSASPKVFGFSAEFTSFLRTLLAFFLPF